MAVPFAPESGYSHPPECVYGVGPLMRAASVLIRLILACADGKINRGELTEA
jgi:hypothetical protein